MKRSSLVSRSRRVSGFTLVELLVVIAIIAILAATVLTTGGALINMAKRAKANNLCTQIQTATLAFNTEYSVYPATTSPAPTVDTVVSTAPQWGVITEILCGSIDPNNPTVAITTAPGNMNTRQISYLILNKADLDTTVTPSAPKLPFKSSTGGVLYPQMTIDYDYSNVLGDSTAAAAPPDFNGTLSTLTTVTYPFPTANLKAIGWRRRGLGLWRPKYNGHGDEPSSSGFKTY